MSVFGNLKSLINRVGMCFVQWTCAREYKSQDLNTINERPIEFAFVFRQLVALWPGKILDVGTGMTALPHLMRNCGFHVTAIDNIKDYWPKGMVNRHYHVINDDITNTSISESYDVITCVSVLEHIQEFDKAIKSMCKLLAPRGYLILTCPYNEKQYVNNVYLLPESAVVEQFSFITQAFSREEINIWLKDMQLELIEQEYWQFFEGEYWTCGKRVTPPRIVKANDCHQLTCLVLRKLQ